MVFVGLSEFVFGKFPTKDRAGKKIKERIIYYK